MFCVFEWVSLHRTSAVRMFTPTWWLPHESGSFHTAGSGRGTRRGNARTDGPAETRAGSSPAQTRCTQTDWAGGKWDKLNIRIECNSTVPCGKILTVFIIDIYTHRCCIMLLMQVIHHIESVKALKVLKNYFWITYECAKCNFLSNFAYISSAICYPLSRHQHRPQKAHDGVSVSHKFTECILT